MTSKKSYLVKWLENCKRRSWTFLLCLVCFALFLPVAAVVEMNRFEQNLAEEIARGMTRGDMELWLLNQKNLFLRSCGFSEGTVALAIGFGMLFAVQGFSYLYSRKKMDLYMSVPVSAPKRYLMITGNSMAVFGGIYLCNLLLCLVIGLGYDVLTVRVVLEILLSWLLVMFIFFAVYQVALTAVMLTGNVLTALLGCGVLFAYEPLCRVLIQEMKGNFYLTYYAEASYGKQYLTPAANAFWFAGYTGYSDGMLWWTPGGESIPVYARAGMVLLFMALSGLVWGVLAYVLYRKRKTESYGQSMAFSWAKQLIRYLLLIPVSLATGLLVYLWSGKTEVFLWAGALVGLLLGHGTIQLIYERDLRAVGRKLIPLGIAGLAAGFALAVYSFDLGGYDSYVPAAEDVDSVSVTLEYDYQGVGRRYQISFDGSRVNVNEELLEHMESREAATIQAVTQMAAEYAYQIKHSGREYGEVYEENTDIRRWVVRYRLHNGREVYRKFYVDALAMTPQINTVMHDTNYQQLRYQILDPSFADSLDRMKIVYSNGISEYLFTLEKEDLYQAFAEEMKAYDYSLIVEQLPVGALEFSLADSVEGILCSWLYPVYPAFEKTLQLLADNGIPVWQEAALDPADVESISVNYYYVGDQSEIQAAIYEKETVAEAQNLSITVSDPDKIAVLLEALYPDDLRGVTDSNLHRYREFDSGYDVTIHLSAAAKQKRMEVPYMLLMKDKIPDFLLEDLKKELQAE